MPEPLAPQYNPKDIETRWSEFWATSPLLHAAPDPKKKPYTILIPPPNVTGILHMGHALNNTIQDILIRVRRMQGCEALWMPGTDHAGIATQNVVERKLAKEGKTRRDLGRGAFVDQVWAWKKEYGSTIIRQLKRMGATCDWSRERFTMDEGYSEAVKDVFVRLYDKGLIYQGDYIINWCPRCQTALADEEAPHKDLDGKLYYIKYPLKKSPVTRHPSPVNKKKAVGHVPSAMDGVIVATTRPETMLGDTAVAVHPTDKRYKDLIGATLVLPLVEREIRIISDRLIDKKFGTGAVKVTPAHDPNDYLMGRSHNLEFINIMNPDGVLNANAGEYAGMDRFEAREAIIEELRERKLLVKIDEHKHAVGHCYRCHTIIEPYLSKQWFVKMAPLARPAIQAVKKGDIRFTPQRWTKVYLNWMENIKDWCISRQIWWGHRLPVWYCDECLRKSQAGKATRRQETRAKGDKATRRTGVIVSRAVPQKCPDCGNAALRQDEDVLDTWFSSWLWPFATFGWPHGNRKDLDYFYPTHTLVTAPEIIFFWVARMIMAGFEFMGQKPFSDVYIHGTVRDEEGKKMSKSLGNSIDPLQIIDQYGADALRFSLMAIAASGSDIFLSTERFEQGRNFCNKIWNASRFILMNLQDGVKGDAIDKTALRLQDQWILHELNDLIKKTDKAIDAFKFNEAVNLLYGFFWHSFCDWYLEAAKSDIGEKNTQEVLVHVLKSALLLLHPFMPFITEEIATKLPGAAQETLALASWPKPDKARDDKACASSMKLAFETVSFLRLKRHDLGVPVTKKISVSACVKSRETRHAIESVLPLIKRMAQVESWAFIEGDATPQDALSGLVGKDLRLFLLLEGLVDSVQEKARLDQEIAALSGLIRQKEALLANKGFAQRAPQDVVLKETAKLQELKVKRAGLQEVRHAFK